jgi:hypothetical protein
VIEAETLDEMSTGYGDPANLQKVSLPFFSGQGLL